MSVIIQQRFRILVNTDPQRRCYDGVNFSEAWIWTAWDDLETLRADADEERVRNRLRFWRELNDYAVAARGESARCEFKAATL